MQSECAILSGMFDTDEALAKIEEIHHHLAKSGIYRGYRSFVVAFSGIIGILAAILQPLVVQGTDSFVFVGYWGAVAGINLILCTVMILYRFLFRETRFEQQKTLTVLIQFIPMILAGCLVTPFLAFNGAATIPLLPGVWALLFGMGILNVRPYLTNHTLIPALFYFAGAGLLFYLRYYDAHWLTAGMGAVFGTGQLLSALVLYLGSERSEDGKKAG